MVGFFKDVADASGITDTLFGDPEAAMEAQSAENRASRDFFSGKVDEAMGRIDPLFNAAQKNRQQGNQGALDILGGGLRSQLDAFRQGNVGAQAALMGGNFTPQSLNFDTGFIPETLPQVVTEQDEVRLGNTNLLAGLTDNLQLFQAAARGEIPNISEADQRFFAEHAQNVLNGGGDNSRHLINRPGNRDFVGKAGGFNSKNEGRLSNLLNQVQLLGAK